MKLDINPEWNYVQVLRSIVALKTQYKSFLVSFSNFEQHEKVLFMKETKEKIYSLKIDKWRIDRLWEYMNGDEEFDILKKLLKI